MNPLVSGRSKDIVKSSLDFGDTVSAIEADEEFKIEYLETSV